MNITKTQAGLLLAIIRVTDPTGFYSASLNDLKDLIKNLQELLNDPENKDNKQEKII